MVNLPEFDFVDYKYLQEEVKVAGAADTAYYVLDNKSADDLVDRKSLDNSAYAQNALRLEGRQLGFGAGNIPFLDEEGKLDSDLMADDSWLDPVADAAALGGLVANAGDVVFVVSDGQLYTYTGTQWESVVNSSFQEDVSSLGGRMDDAETNITSLGAQILSNDADIAANTNAIQLNSADLAQQSQDIATHAADILAHDTALASSVSAIQANELDIASNLAGIQMNSEDIASNVTGLSVLDARVASTEALSAQNAADIAASLVASDWKEAVVSVVDLAATYPSAEAGWSAYVIDEEDIYVYNGVTWGKSGVSDLAPLDAALTAVEVDVANNMTEIATNAADIVLTNLDVAANLGSIQSLDADLTTTSANVASNSVVISQNVVDISTNATNIMTNATAIASVGSDIEAIASGVASNETAITENTEAVANNATGVAQNETDIAANNVTIDAVKTFSSANFDVFILP